MAFWNADDVGSMLLSGPSSLPCPLGFGKLGTPLARMHSANLTVNVLDDSFPPELALGVAEGLPPPVPVEPLQPAPTIAKAPSAIASILSLGCWIRLSFCCVPKGTVDIRAGALLFMFCPWLLEKSLMSWFYRTVSCVAVTL